MIVNKKISSDILYLALTVALLRLGPDILQGEWQEPLEAGDVFLGSSLAYRQFYTHNMYVSSNRYINLKTMDAVIMDEAMSVRDHLDYYSGRNVARGNVIAFYSDIPDVQRTEERNNNRSSAEESSSNGTASTNGTIHSDVSDAEEHSSVQSDENFYSSTALDLSREDMDLIEILWKQDIDLGVSRDAFNSRENPELEELKAGAELSKDKKEIYFDEIDLKKHEECEDISLYSEWEGMGYTVDSETGEHIIKGQEPDDVQQSISQDQGVLCAQSPNQSFLNDVSFGDLSPSLFSCEDNDDFNITKALIDDELNQSLNDPLFLDPDVLAEQVEKLERLLTTFDNEYPDQGLETGSEMYPSMEEYWQDISTTLPLSVMGASAYSSSLSALPRPSPIFPEVTDATASTSSEFHGRMEPGDGYAISLLHNASLTQRGQDINNSFSYLPPLLGPTSLGCAVASSIATLTNDTDPGSDIGGTLNGSYGLDPSSLHVNHTPVASANETLLSEMLLDEELQLMNVGTAVEPEVVCSSMSKIMNDHLDLSSDSANSSTSGNISSMSDCNENRRMKYEELTCAEHGGKDALYATSKYSLGQPEMNLAYRHHHADPSHDQNYNFGIPSSYRSNYSHYLQHNHSYHLPFVNGNSSPKPVTRDKSRHSRCDDETNRDEKRAKALKIPITISDIINLAIDEFNEKLSKFELTEPQLTLIRDIRRRGKNKVAAQNCRKRKMDQITSLQHDLDLLHAERLELENDRTQLLHQRRSVHDKYSQLRQLVLQSTSQSQSFSSLIPSPQQSSSNTPLHTVNTSTSDAQEAEKDIVYQGVRTKQKSEKKKLDYS